MQHHHHEHAAAIKRMSYLIGHLQGVKKMMEDGQYCVDIISQNQGVISALRKVNQELLKTHMNSCVIEAVRGNNPNKRREKISELLKIFGSLK